MNTFLLSLAILVNWPFAKLDASVEIAEAWIYKGTIGDVAGSMHKGLDFVRLTEDGEYIPFKVYAMHDGVAYQGEVESWGPFVLIRYWIDDEHWVDTLYAHLDNIPAEIPKLANTEDGGAVFPEEAPEESKPQGLPIKAGTLIGVAGQKGWSNGVNHLHLELHLRGPETASLGLGKRDPLGVYDYISRKNGEEEFSLYPQPGESLEGLPHWFTSNNPPFASE